MNNAGSELSAELMREARAFALTRRTHKRRKIRDVPVGWGKLGAGCFGEAWSHREWPNYVVKISGSEGFPNTSHKLRGAMQDGWQVFAEHCYNAAVRHKHLPRVLHFERLSDTVAFAVLPRYESITYAIAKLGRERVWGGVDELYELRDILSGNSVALPEWAEGVRRLMEYNGLSLDLHNGNVMWDTDLKTWVLTDPFIFRD